MNALILGGSGGLSSVLARLASENYTVYALTRGVRPLPECVHSLIADRNQNAEFEKVIIESGLTFDVVFDCICMNEYHAKQDIAVLSKVTKRLVVISTDSVYDPLHKKTPQNEEGIFIEETCEMEQGTYAGNKRKMEHVFIDYMSRDEAELQITILRPGHIYGPGFLLGCFPEHSRQADLPKRILNREPIALVGLGTYLTQPIFVEDLARVMLDCAMEPKTYQQIFCVGGPEAVENRRYYETIAEVLDVPIQITEIPLQGYLEAHPEYGGHLCHRIYDLTKLKEAGVPLPKTGLKESITLHLKALGY